MNKAAAYIENIQRLINEVLHTQLPAIESASREIAKALENEKKVFLFGTGHSHILAEEMFFRAGGLVKIQPVLEDALMLHTSASKSSELQQLKGYADIIFEHYRMRKGDVLVIFSYSGQSGVCIDLARLANERGLILIALTNTKRAKASGSRHVSGKCLYEFADIVIENIGDSDDASIEIEGVDVKVAATSTVIGATIMNAIVARTVEILSQRGVDPEVFAGGDSEHNCEIDTRYVKKYMGEIEFL